MRAVLSSIAFLVALVAASAAALAHATLVSSVPAAGSKVSPSPTELRLTFSELIDVVSAKLTGRGGKVVPTGAVRADDAVLVIPLKAPLPPGVYQVNWQVMSTDGHKRGGRLSFEVSR